MTPAPETYTLFMTMRRIGSSPFAFPDFSGATRQLILINLGTYFALAIAGLSSSRWGGLLAARLAFDPFSFIHGALWQPFTYSFVHLGIIATLFELLSLWFLAGFLETYHNANWIWLLYGVSVLGTALAALAIAAVSGGFGIALPRIPLYGSFGGVFGMLAAIGILYGDTEFLMFFVIGIKARYLALIYGLIAIAMLFGEQRMYAFAQLGGAIAGILFVRAAPRRGMSFMVSESWYGLRNRYYRWKRRRAARKFEVYMRSQGRTVRLDGQGRVIHEDDDKKRWN
jgi:membrane associated rhomboid family serine protease